MSETERGLLRVTSVDPFFHHLLATNVSLWYLSVFMFDISTICTGKSSNLCNNNVMSLQRHSWLALLWTAI